jgi:hypothetical protein
MRLEAAPERGAEAALGGYDWAWAQGPMFSPRHFEEFIFLRLREITNLCHRHAVPYVKYTDFNVDLLLEGMVEAGVDAFQ